VFRLMVNGRSDKQIAALLRISEHTAKFHVSSVARKTRCKQPHRDGQFRDYSWHGCDLVGSLAIPCMLSRQLYIRCIIGA
jgi:hypothetical protein